ncbi:MAG: aminopeptidase P family protein [Bacteroidaceae bacterium]|nr:aminopeptidase P family protein [Bacteroidaceae bacterium]
MSYNIIQERVKGFRSYMSEKGYGAFIIVSSDPHSSEYVADCWKSREWISGFDGSAGTVVITADKALLWTDSRYWLAAEKALAGTGYELMKDGAGDTPSIPQWLCDNLSKGDVVAIDGTVCSVVEANAWHAPFAEKGIMLDYARDPFEELWSGRPSLPLGKAEIMPEEVAGETAKSKLARLRAALEKEGVEGMLVTMLDEVAWLTNLRGNDVEYNPVVVAYMIVTLDSAVLYIDARKLTVEVRDYLNSQGITVAGYSDIWQALKEYARNTILIQPSKCNVSAAKAIEANKAVFRADSPVAKMKAVKNNVEIEGFRRSMLSEGVAMAKLLHWLKPAVEKGGIRELDVDNKLTELRSADEMFKGLSFATIAAYGANAAIVHYEPTPEENALLKPQGFLLLDCGGQYIGGTTDITRTIPLGPLTEEEKADYTRVLRGHISLAMAKFPKGTCGTQLDVLARQWLWQAGENYLHGTGHGVGHCLNVHEGPHQIRMNNMPAHLLPGMTVTNEPGLYKAGRYGIRIENTMLIKEYCEGEFGEFYEMEPLTLCPIDTTAIIPELLGSDAIEYLNSYHAHVYEMLSPYLEDEELEFLKQACKRVESNV